MSIEKPFESKPGILQKLRRRFSRNKDLRESLEGVIESHAQESGEPAMAEDARSMLGNLLGFAEVRVDDLMVPRADIECIDESATLQDLLKLFTTANHSRLPVYRETLDDVTGFIHVKDFLSWIAAQGKTRKSKSSSVAGISIPAMALAGSIKQHQSLVRDVLHVPPSMPAPDLLLQMRSSRVHMAVVVDEYGGTDGLVSFEDLVEAIIGDIADEHDADDEAKLIKKQGENTYMADARIAISSLDQIFGVDLLPEDQEDEAHTLAGLLFEMGGRIPNRGEIIKHASGLEFEIVQTDPRRVKRVRIHVKKPEPPEEPGGEQSG